MTAFDAGSDARGRVTTTVRCRARRHVLARVLVRGDGHRLLEVPRLAVFDVDDRRPGQVRVSAKLGGLQVDLDDEANPRRWDSFRVACACGSDFLIHPATHLAPRPLMRDVGGFLYRVEGQTVSPPSLILLNPLPTRR